MDRGQEEMEGGELWVVKSITNTAMFCRQSLYQYYRYIPLLILFPKEREYALVKQSEKALKAVSSAGFSQCVLTYKRYREGS